MFWPRMLFEWHHLTSDHNDGLLALLAPTTVHRWTVDLPKCSHHTPLEMARSYDAITTLSMVKTKWGLLVWQTSIQWFPIDRDIHALG